MLDKKRVEEVLEDFGKYLIKESRKNLTRKKINASKELYNSLKSELKVSKNSLDFDFLMEYYGEFIDKGVSGTDVKYRTPFSYKTKQPPQRVIKKWIRQKGFRGRDNKGRFISNDSLSFLIARSIKKRGLKPTHFYSRPFELAFARLPDDIIEAYGLDLEDFLDFSLNKNLKNANI